MSSAWELALSVIEDQQALIASLVKDGNAALADSVSELGSKIDNLTGKVNAMGVALTNLQNAETALKQEVVTVLADVASRLASSEDEADVQAVADDITNNVIPQLVAGDPAVTVPPAAAPAAPPASS